MNKCLWLGCQDEQQEDTTLGLCRRHRFELLDYQMEIARRQK